MNLGFYMPTKVIVGKNCVRENSDVFKIGKKALIVTGKNSAKSSGALDDVKYALEKNNIEYVIFDKVMSNPTVECVYDGAETAMEEEVDFVIAIGGGSPMDSAKAIALLAVSDIERKNLFDGNIGTSYDTYSDNCRNRFGGYAVCDFDKPRKTDKKKYCVTMPFPNIRIA